MAAEGTTPPLFARWMLGALLAGLALGGPALWGYLDYQATWQRPPPKVPICFLAMGKLLRAPALVAPSEPFLDPKEETVYLTSNQLKAVQCANALSHGTDRELARALSEQDPDTQAKTLADLTLGRLAKPETELDAVGLYHISAAVLEGLPQSDATRAERRRLDEGLGCTFVSQRLPACAARPDVPTWVWLLGGVGGFALCLVPASLLQRLVSRVGKKTAKKAEAKPEAPAGPKPEAPADAKGDDDA